MKHKISIFFVLFIGIAISQTTTYSPSNNRIQLENQVEFAWNACTNATQYELQTDVNQGFSTPQSVLVTGTDTLLSFSEGQYFFRVRCFENGVWSPWSDTRNFRVIALSSFGNLVLWLDAGDASTVVKDASNRVSSWRNKINPAISFNQANINFQPSWIASENQLNSKPLLRFDGINDFLNGGNVLNMGTNNAGFFIVAKSNLPTARYFFAKALAATQPNRIGLGHSGVGELTLIFHDNLSRTITAPNNVNFRLYSVIANRQSSESTARMFSSGLQLGNTLSIADNTHNFSSTFRFLIGAYNNANDNGEINHLNGDIAEFIVFHSSISDSIRTIIEQYLRHKYMPPVNLGADINIAYRLCDTTLNAAKPWFTSYLWNNGATTPGITINQSGSYFVTVTDILGFQSSDTIEVKLESVETNIQDSLICLGESLLFTANVDPGIYTYLWQDNSSDSFIVVNTTSNIFFSVSDSTGCVFNSDTFTVFVDSFKNQISLGNDTSICSGNSISLIEGEELVETFLWSTGENSNSISVTSSGQYSVEIINSNGCIANDTINVAISGIAPISDFTADTVCVGLSTGFLNTSSVLAPDIIASSRWIIENDTIFSTNAGYSFSSSGIYSVNLRNITDAGCESGTTKLVRVLESPMAVFLPEQEIGCIANSIEFNNSSLADSIDNIVLYFWSFGDGQNGTGIHPSHTYTSGGTYGVQLNITTQYGCTDSSEVPLVVIESAPLLAPSKLIVPAQNFVDLENNVHFGWHGNSDADFYELQLSETNDFNTIFFSTQTSDTSVLVQNLPNQIIFWRVLTYNLCNDLSSSFTRTLTVVDINQLGNLVLWLDAGDTSTVVKDASNRVSSWRNKVNPAIAFNQTNINFQPNWIASENQLNAQPLIRFDGTNDFINGGDVLNIGTNSASFFIVAKSNLPTSRYFFAKALAAGEPNRFGFGHSGTEELTLVFHDNVVRNLTSQSNLNYRLYSIIANRQTSGSNARLFSRGLQLGNTVSIANNTHNFTSNYRFLIGAYNNANDNGEINYLNGDIAEFIIYHSAIGDSTRTLIEQYLRHKYAPPVNLGRDIAVLYNLCDTAINAFKPWFTSYLWTGPNGFTSNSASITIPRSGTYAVTVTDIFGYTSSDSINVIIPERPFIENQQFICQGQSKTFNVNIGSDYTYLWNETLASPLITIETPGNYFYLIQDSTGCFLTDTFTVAIDSFETQLSLGPDTSLCTGNILNIVSSGSFPVNAYSWSTGETDSFATISNSGFYSVTAINNNGCEAVDSVFVTVLGNSPEASFVYSDTCNNVAVNFTDVSSVNGANLISWEWDFGNGINSSNQNPFVEFETGLYSVFLRVGSDAGCFSTTQKNIQIKSSPTASFGQSIVCAQSTALFFDNSTPAVGSSLSSWLWVSSDGQLSNLQNPNNLNFQNEGEFDLTLIVRDNFGCKDSIAQTIEVFPALLPDFTAENFCVGDSVRFQDATASFSVVGRLWNFGQPNAFSTLPNPAFRYSGAGIYNVNLTVENAIGCVNSITKPVEIFEVPVISIQSENACLGAEIDVWSVANTNVNDLIVSYNWSVNGISSPTNSDSIRVLIEETGSVSLALDVITEGGCNASASTSLQVLPLPVASFNFSPNYGTAPQTIQFTNQSTGAVAYNWTFGDGSGESFDENPVYTYTSNNNYLVVLEAFSADGCFSIAQRNVPIIPSELDIELSSLVLQTTLSNGISLVKPRITVTNIGTRAVENIDFYVRLNEQVELFEKWEGLLPPAASFTFEFVGQYALSQGVNARYVCVEARDVNDGTELNLENNKACKVLKGQVQLSEIYPNPATGRANIDMITESSGTADLALYEVSGKKIFELKGYQLERGLNKISLDLSLLQSGKYNLTISYLNDDFVKPLLLINK